MDPNVASAQAAILGLIAGYLDRAGIARLEHIALDLDKLATASEGTSAAYLRGAAEGLLEASKVLRRE